MGSSDRHAHDRLTFLLGATFGSMVTVTTKSGDKFDGIMSGSTAQAASLKITLKMAKKQHTSQGGHANGIAAGEAALVGAGPEHSMSFDNEDITEIFIAELSPTEPAKLPNGAFLYDCILYMTDIAQVQVPSFRQIPKSHETRLVASAHFNAGYPRQAMMLIFHLSPMVLPAGISLRRTNECSEQLALSTRTITPLFLIAATPPSSGDKRRQTGLLARSKAPYRQMLTCAKSEARH